MDILKHTTRVTLELSNLCNYASRHPGCPAHCIDAPQILPARIVHDVLDTLAEARFAGCLAWHVYNEPLLDPRLVQFITYARSGCPNSDILVWSNGWYLNRTLTEKLIVAGVTRFTLSAYTDEDYRRLQALRDGVKHLQINGRPVHVHVIRIKQLDGRLTDGSDGGSTNRHPCHAPLGDVTIRASGRIGLCCFDWREQETFGNLHQTSFRRAMETAGDRMQQLRAELTRGVRTPEVCRRCRTWRNA